MSAFRPSLLLVDIPSQDDINVFVRVKAKEARPLRIGIQGSVTTT